MIKKIFGNERLFSWERIMICLDCGNRDIRYDEKEKSYHCNNCGSRNIGAIKDACKYMKDGLCGKGASSTGKCKIPCSFYER